MFHIKGDFMASEVEGRGLQMVLSRHRVLSKNSNREDS